MFSYGFFMEKHREGKIHKKEGEPLQKMGETTADAMDAVLNKLAGPGNSLKINLQDLTVGEAPLQAKISGTMTLNITLPKE
jgi:hypothetical protein